MMIGGTLLSGVIRILVVVATLAATYYFLVRPVLDTTERVTTGLNGNLERTINNTLERSGVSPSDRISITQMVGSTSNRDAGSLKRCVNRAGANTNRIRRCVRRFSR